MFTTRGGAVKVKLIAASEIMHWSKNFNFFDKVELSMKY